MDVSNERWHLNLRTMIQTVAPRSVCRQSGLFIKGPTLGKFDFAFAFEQQKPADSIRTFRTEELRDHFPETGLRFWTSALCDVRKGAVETFSQMFVAPQL